jgi:predicted Zn finger-like uncharacterized protein
MDVRCDRCQTEYELDDESVAEGGASVQCTSCGNTFVVGRARRAGTPLPTQSISMSPSSVSGGPPTSSWMLTTEEGKTHRFRDSTTLQKWVVERRVGRADRVCPPGGAWRRLGDVDELRPFFDVVDQADRAAASARTARPTRPETPRTSAQARNAYVSPDADDDDILTSGSDNDRRGLRQSAVSESLAMLASDDDLLPAGLGTRHGGRKLAIGVVVVLGVIAAYLGFKGTSGFRFPGSPSSAAEPAAAPPPPAAPVAAPAPPPAAAPAPVTTPAAAPSLAPAPAPTLAAPSAPAAAPPASATTAPPAPAPVARPMEPPADEPAAPAEPGAAPSRAGASPAEAGRAKSYPQLVADADRALENGQTIKAQKLYDEALRLQPSGVGAVTGAAYLLLDRQKPLAAIDMFQRALSNSPSFPQALFGLGEAHRLAGQPAKAVEAYKKYLETTPTGPDAPAARRQMRELESQAAATPPAQETPAPTAPTSPPPPL